VGGYGKHTRAEENESNKNDFERKSPSRIPVSRFSFENEFLNSKSLIQSKIVRGNRFSNYLNCQSLSV
jgi:hypothetical protein